MGSKFRSDSRRSSILTDQSAKIITPLDNDRVRRCRLFIRWPAIWWLEVQARVCPVIVVMINEDGEDALEMTRVRDQQTVQAFGSNRPHEAFRDAIRLRDLNRRQHDPAALGLKKASKLFPNLRS